MNSFNKDCIIDRSTFHLGYSVIKNLASDELVNEVLSEVGRITNCGNHGWLSSNSARTERGEFIVIRSIDTPSDLFFQLGRDRVLCKIAEEIGQKKVTPMYSEFFSKPPESESGTPVHQDQAFYEKHFNDELGITFWVALDPCDKSNGGMCVRPTEHRILLPHEKSNALGFGYQMKDQSKCGFVEIALERGDALLHCAYTPHFCHPNSTAFPRRAVAITFRTSQYREELFGG